MTLQSMTGFARSEGSAGRFRWAWELRSVNGKGLDLRIRLPQGAEHFEADVRRRVGVDLSRGNLQIGLSVSTDAGQSEMVINQAALSAVLALREQLGGVIDPAPLRLDTLIAMRGVVELREHEETPEERSTREEAMRADLDVAVASLRRMREEEGLSLGRILFGQLDRIEELTRLIEADPSRSPAAIAERLSAQVAVVMDGTAGLDRDRLHAEVAVLATKSDLREEIDRLYAHVAAVRELLRNGGPVGRKLDFLAQEFNRESNTICSKSNAVDVTAAGIELKVVIDQFREQVQNLE